MSSELIRRQREFTKLVGKPLGVSQKFGGSRGHLKSKGYKADCSGADREWIGHSI